MSAKRPAKAPKNVVNYGARQGVASDTVYDYVASKINATEARSSPSLMAIRQSVSAAGHWFSVCGSFVTDTCQLPVGVSALKLLSVLVHEFILACTRLICQEIVMP